MLPLRQRRAGEAGKGFAVVATEIGALATQTQNAVGDIDSIIGEVHNAVSGMVDCLQNAMDFWKIRFLAITKDLWKLARSIPKIRRFLKMA